MTDQLSATPLPPDAYPVGFTLKCQEMQTQENIAIAIGSQIVYNFLKKCPQRIAERIKRCKQNHNKNKRKGQYYDGKQAYERQ
jgi:hypothetical protein